MLIVEESGGLIADCHHRCADHTRKFREWSSRNVSGSGGLTLPAAPLHVFKFDIFYPCFSRMRSVFRILYAIFVVNSSMIDGVKGDGTCSPEMRVKELGGITCDIQNDILEAHNNVRQAVAANLIENQPPASNMREMYWDEELARGAQDWASHCLFAHNNAAQRKSVRFEVGQNIAVTKNKGKIRDSKDFQRQIQNWFNEHVGYKFSETTEAMLAFTGHYTQLVWADTHLVGCGYSRYENSITNISYRLYVCNYGPSGNVYDEEPYKMGGRKCPRGTVPSRKYSALCAKESPPTNVCTESSDGPTRRKLQTAELYETSLKNYQHRTWLHKLQPAIAGGNRKFYKSNRRLSYDKFSQDIKSLNYGDVTTYMILRITIVWKR